MSAPTKKYQDFMIDIETTGVKPGCKVLSIAVVPLFENYKNIFYEKIAANKYPVSDFHSNNQTMEWWQKQDVVVRTTAFSGIHSPVEVITKLSEYFASFTGDAGAIRVWGNGASFDVPILEYIYDYYQLPYPWSYRASMCYRTAKELFSWIPFTKPTIAHDALEDARAQATHLEMILTWLRVQDQAAAKSSLKSSE